MIDDAPTLARVCMLLAVLVEEVRGLRADMAGRKPSSSTPRVLSAGDIAMLTDLLPAIVAAMGGAAVTVRSLHVAAGARTSEAKSLRAALDATGLDPLRLGRLLARAAKSEMQIEGLFAHRLGKSRGSVVFFINAKAPGHHLAASMASAMCANLQA